MSSPPSGRSTFTTSAPRSPSSIAASGPASTREKSATRIPSKGGMGRHTSAPVRTLVISDLHLGRNDGRDLLRRPDLRTPLLEALDDVDRLVILGDGLELREAAHRDAVAVRGRVLRRRRAHARPRQGADRPRRQPRSRDRGGLDRLAAADRAGRLPRPRGALHAHRRAGRATRRGRPPRAPAVRLPRDLAARGRLRAARPLRRPARHRPDLRADRRGRDGEVGRGDAAARRARRTTTRPCSRRCTRGCTRSRSAPTTRS